MKNNFKIIVYVITFFTILFSCTKDVDIQDQFDFDTNIIVQDSGYVYEAVPLDIKISPQRQVSGTTYKLSFKVEEGGAYLESGTSPVITIKKDEIFKFSSVDKSQLFKFIPTSIGINKILVTIEDSNGLKKTQELIYYAKLAPFTFLLTPNLNAYTINTRGAITCTLIRKEEDVFSMTYVVENGTGTLYNGVEAIPVGKAYNMVGGATQLHYVPTTLGLHKITAIVTASDGAKITRTIDILVDNVPFSLNATASATTINVNQELTINLDLQELQKGITSTYEMTHSYDSKGIAGTIKNISGAVMNAGVYTAITPGTYQYKFKASTQGTSTITFKVKDNNGQIKETSITINVSNVAFTFTGTSSNKTILLNETSKLNFNIVPNATDTSGVSYVLSYQAESGDGIMTDSDGKTIQRGTPISVNKGVFSFNYKPTSIGNHIINAVVTDNNGESRTVRIEMESIHTPVTFNVSSVTQTYVNQPVTVDFVVTPQLNSNLAYEMNYYISGGQGQLKNYDSAIKTGEYFSVSKGGFKYQFNPTIAGNFVLNFELKDSNGQIVKKEINLIVLNNKFTFTPTASQKVFVNETNIFSFALVPTGTYAGTTYNISYTIEAGQLGTFSNNGNEIQQGIPITIAPTTFNLQYKPTTKGEHKIHYIITESNGLKEEVVQTVNVIASDFNLKIQQANSTIYKNNSDVLLLSLAQENLNKNISYSLTYTITGVGTILKDGIPLPNFSAITPGNHSYTFSSNQSGTTEIVFVIADSNGIFHSQTVKYTTVNPDFTISTSGDGSFNLNQSKDFNIYLSQLVSDPTASYEVKFLIESGSIGEGKVFNGSVEVPLGIFQKISIGTTRMAFRGITAGAVNLKVEVKDSNGIIHSSNVIFDVLSINYTFSGSAQANTIYVNGSTPINFDISETAVSGTNYEMKYSFVEGDGTIKNGANTENANTWYPVSIGSFSRTFVGSATGDVKMTFTVRNTTTLVEKTQNITINVKASEFTFGAAATDNNVIVKSGVNVNLNLVQTGGGVETYSMTFSTTGTGTFTYGGTTYTAGQNIPITVGASSGSYKGTTAGDHDVVFTVVSQNNVSKTASVKVNFVANDFTLSTSGDGTLNANTSKSIYTYISQETTDSSITYEVKYSVVTGSTGAGTITQNGTAVTYGIFQSASVGSTALTFTGTDIGTVNIKVEVKDSNGISHNSIISLEIKPINYTFSGAAQDNTIYVNGSTPINFDITETANSGTQYEMKYVMSSGNGQIKNGSIVENANTWYPVSIGSFSRNIVGTSVGNINVTFTVRNKITLVEKTDTISINVIASVFTFGATGTNVNNNIVNSNSTINFNLTQTGGSNDVYSMTFSTTGTGTFTYDGTTYTAGQNIPISIGASSGSYKGTTDGEHSIVFTVTNQLNSSKSSTVKLNYINNDFTLSSAGDGSFYMGQSQDLTIFLSQLIPDNSITYQVRYGFESGTTGNGIIQKNGINEALGVYTDIALGTQDLKFIPTKPGLVKVSIDVVNNLGVKKTTIILLNVQSTDFTITSALVNSNVIVGEETSISFDLSENITSSTEYEMKYVITQGNADLKNSGTTLVQNVWENVNVGSYFRELTINSSSDVKITFSVRNKLSGVIKTSNLNITPYTKPSLTNILTGENNSGTFNCGGGECTRTYSKYISFNSVLNSGATLTSVKITVGYSNDAGTAQVGYKTFTITNFTKATVSNNPAGIEGTATGYITFKWFNSEIAFDYFFDGKPYTLEITDSNGVTNTINGTFTGSLADNQ